MKDGLMAIRGLRLPVPILDDLVLYAGMDNTSLTAKADITEEGAAINGLLMGYLSSNSIMEITKSIINACAPGDQPTICPIISNEITYESDPEDAFPTVVSFMGGYDARLSDSGTPEFVSSPPKTCYAVQCGKHVSRFWCRASYPNPLSFTFDRPLLSRPDSKNHPRALHTEYYR